MKDASASDFYLHTLITRLLKLEPLRIYYGKEWVDTIIKDGWREGYVTKKIKFPKPCGDMMEGTIKFLNFMISTFKDFR